ncbi:ABC transporter substrate-binding protein [Tepiditoga spiralis]|uniref:ABC transporter substrate-binding protein n=1 Tax=Tepiditoga spiralis TaxID=2108365 RepID=A0A7G1GAD9_9BACT|nr:transporter substrate-binding domain-containing protein [Tepiditoga spiralis]BBE32083.1 ABC transporter substrate-binding protein [Tepiditoga spiralis]
MTNGEWAPYLSEKLKYYGFFSRVVTDSFKNVGIKVEYGFFPWKRSYVLAENGSWDGSLGWSRNEEREKSFYYSDPVIELKDFLFYKKDKKIKFESYEDLRGKTIGIVIGYYYGKEFEKAQKAGIFKVDQSTSDEINLKKLLAGRIDCTILTYDIAMDILKNKFKKEEIEQITNTKKPTKVSPYYLILNKKDKNNENIIKLFNKGLKQLKESGKYDQYLKEMYEGKY